MFTPLTALTNCSLTVFIPIFKSVFETKMAQVRGFFLFSLLFGLTEYVRGNVLTGFPWNLIIYSFSENINFLSFLSVIGTYSFNLLVISFFMLLTLIFIVFLSTSANLIFKPM